MSGSISRTCRLTSGMHLPEVLPPRRGRLIITSP